MKKSQKIRFFYIAPSQGVHAWDLPRLPDPKIVDVNKYKELFLRAVQEVLQPLGVTEAILRRWVFSVVTAHLIARVVYRMLKYQVEYEPLNGAKYEKHHREQ